MADKKIPWQDANKLQVDMGDNTYAERILAHPPFDLMTDGGDGPNRRLRVDVAQTSFFAGREFRTFFDLTLAAGATRIFKVVTPVDTVVYDLDVLLVEGEFSLETLAADGTEGGTFSTSLPIRPANIMSSVPTPVYSPQLTVATGGTYTGGTQLDIIRASSTGIGTASTSIIAGVGLERGISAGTYYIRLINTGSVALVGVLRSRWEERPSGV